MFIVFLNLGMLSPQDSVIEGGGGGGATGVLVPQVLAIDTLLINQHLRPTILLGPSDQKLAVTFIIST